MPNMSDTARKRYVADWVVKMKRQVVKVYAIAKWSRDAGVVQKAMVHTTVTSSCVALRLMREFRTSRPS